jgi:hypothetical protein
VYRNLGHCFAAKHVIETIIPDYRLVKHGGKHPSGTEDLAPVLHIPEQDMATEGLCLLWETLQEE